MHFFSFSHYVMAFFLQKQFVLKNKNMNMLFFGIFIYLKTGSKVDLGRLLNQTFVNWWKVCPNLKYKLYSTII